MFHLTVYICLLTLPNDSAHERVRRIVTFRSKEECDAVFLQIPTSIFAVQALDLFAIFAPLGILPNELIATMNIGVGRGYVVMAQTIASACQLGLNASLQLERTEDLWGSVEVWTWLSLCSSAASLAMEDDRPRCPADFDNATNAARMLSAMFSEQIRQSSLSATQCRQAIGKLALCERVLRLAEVHAASAKTYALFDFVVESQISDNPKACSIALDSLQHLEELDNRFDLWLGEFGGDGGVADRGHSVMAHGSIVLHP